jgi:hypothetical protein
MVLDRADYAFGQASRLGPGTVFIRRDRHHSMPSGRGSSQLVKKEEWSSRRVEEDGIPAWLGIASYHATGSDLDRCRPGQLVTMGQPNPDVPVSLRCPAEPGSDQSGGSFDDRRGVTLGERGGAENVLAQHNSGGLNRCGGCGDGPLPIFISFASSHDKNRRQDRACTLSHR